MKNPIPSIDSNSRPLMISIITLLTIFTFSQRYPMDDAFISYRYAKFFAAGEGMVWNVGERVEGYTNFLWTFLLGLGLKLGVAPERFAIILSLPCYVGSLWLTYRLGLVLSGSQFAALASLLFVGFNRSVYAFATSGLETTLQMAQFLAILLLLNKLIRADWPLKWTGLLSGLIGISLLTRLDAAIPAAVAGYSLYRSGRWRDRRVLFVAALPCLAIVAPWLIWKFAFYGALLPNSFHIKVQGLANIGYGIFYIHLFALANLLHVHFGILTFHWRSLRSLAPGAFEAALLTALWLTYTAFVGGDFMEFRFLVPIIPVLLGLMTSIIWKFRSSVMTPALLITLAMGTIQSNFALERLLFGYGVESVWHLRGHLNGRSENWVSIGQILREHFGGSDVVLSVGAAGAIPYYSELKTVDFLGLTDREIASNNEPFSKVPGHRVICSLDYLARRGVNIIVEPNNHMMTSQEFAMWQRNLSWREAYQFYLNPDAKVRGGSLDQLHLFAMPVDEENTLIVWYLRPHPTIDRVITEKGWRTFSVSRW